MFKNLILSIFLTFFLTGCFFHQNELTVKIDLNDDLELYHLNVNDKKYEKLERTNKYELGQGKFNLSLNKYDKINRLTTKRSSNVELINDYDLEIIINNKNIASYEFDSIVKDFSISFVESNNLYGFWKLENDKSFIPSALLVITKDGKGEFLLNQLKIEEIIYKNINELNLNELNRLQDNNTTVKLTLKDEVYLNKLSILNDCMDVEFPTISILNKLEFAKEKFCKIK